MWRKWRMPMQQTLQVSQLLACAHQIPGKRRNHSLSLIPTTFLGCWGSVTRPQTPGFFVWTVKVICHILGDILLILALGKGKLFQVRFGPISVVLSRDLETRVTWVPVSEGRSSVQGGVQFSGSAPDFSPPPQHSLLQIQTPHWEFYSAAISIGRKLSKYANVEISSYTPVKDFGQTRGLRRKKKKLTKGLCHHLSHKHIH